VTANKDWDKQFHEAVAKVEASDEVYDLQNALREANARVAKLKVNSERVAEAAFEGAKSAVLSQKRPAVRAPKSPASAKAKHEVALWHLTDWQGAKQTPSYNTPVMRKRVHNFVDRALSITDVQRADHPVTECRILLGGDMIEGLFNFPTQPFEIDATLFDQFVTVATLIDEVVRRAAAAYDKVEVHCEHGNHGRLGSKRDAVPQSDNADRMTYKLAETMSRDLSNVTYHITPNDIQQVQIGNYRALLIHGDEVGRGGFASPGTIIQHAIKWKSGSYRVSDGSGEIGKPWPFQDLYVAHYHVHQEWALADGEGAVYMTGSTESDNRYARDTMASSAIPSQRLHFIDPRKGRVTAQYKVSVL
jgi:hypothetical protein